jgi:chaperonin GroES
MNQSGIVPLDLRVLIEIEEIAAQTPGGIYIPDTKRDSDKYASNRAKVLEVGQNAFKDWSGERIPSAGDMVLIAKFAGVNVKGNDGKEYRICNDEDIMAVLA